MSHRASNNINLECASCKNQFTSKRGLQRHMTLKHEAKKKSKPSEAIATPLNYSTSTAPMDSTWYDQQATIANQFVTSMQKQTGENEQSPLKELLQQSQRGLQLDYMYFNTMIALIEG